MLVPHHVVDLSSSVDLSHDVFVSHLVNEGLRVVVERTWVPAGMPDPLIRPAERLVEVHGRSGVIRIGEAVVRVRLSGGAVTVQSAARTRAESEAAVAVMRRRLPEAVEEARDVTRIAFWNWDAHDANRRERDIETPPWASIAPNYASALTDRLGDLMGRTAPPDGGRLLLLHGPPGTGKTHLIRAIAHAWRSWCVTEYVVDADQLLQGSAQYLTSLLLDGADCVEPEQWRLVVLEDVGEFLIDDAARTQGQGFSRLLNVLDGMLGQTSKLLVLVTTNRPMTTLDPAMTRPGRCALALEVPPLPAGEAAAWLARNDNAAPVGDAATLAELYGVLRGDDPPQPRRAVGFLAPDSVRDRTPT